MKQSALQPETTPNNDVDNVDRQILTVLQDDSRLSFNKVAAKANVSVGTAYNRIKNLEAKGLLKGYTIMVDPVKMGYSITAIILVQAEGSYLTEVENEIAQASAVIALYDITGDYDAAVIAKFKDRNGLNTFIKHLSATPHVKRAVTNVALNTIKEDFRVKFL
jgi:Lrp/AsnC family transcriptional regulator for asnA, asnC and gidA